MTIYNNSGLGAFTPTRSASSAEPNLFLDLTKSLKVFQKQIYEKVEHSYGVLNVAAKHITSDRIVFAASAIVCYHNPLTFGVSVLFGLFAIDFASHAPMPLRTKIANALDIAHKKVVPVILGSATAVCLSRTLSRLCFQTSTVVAGFALGNYIRYQHHRTVSNKASDAFNAVNNAFSESRDLLSKLISGQ